MLWGGTPVALSFTSDSLPPIAVAALRFLLAGIPVWIWCRFRGTSLGVTRSQLNWVLGSAILLFVQIALFNVGTYWTSSSHSTLIINSFLFFVVLIEHFITRTDRLTGRKVFGLSLALTGILLVFWISRTVNESPESRDPATLRGDLVLLASSFLLGFKIIYTKHAVTKVEPSSLVFWHHLIGAGLFVAYSLSTEEIRLDGFTLPATLGILYQGLMVAGVCFPIQAVLLRRHSATQISVFSFLTPVFGVALAVLLRGDHMSPWLIVAGLLVVLGILMVNLRTRLKTDT